MIDINKISEALARTDARLKTLSKEEYGKLSDSLKTLSPLEIVQYQEVKAIAQLENRISLEVAQWIYRTVGNWTGAKLSDKIIITQLIALWTGALHK